MSSADILKKRLNPSYRYVGLAGQVIGMETFGASAPLKELLGRK